MNKIHEEAEIAYLGVTVEELKRVFDAIPSDYFGLTWTSPTRAFCRGPESFIDAFPKRIISTHVSDNDMSWTAMFPSGTGRSISSGSSRIS